MTKAFGNLGGKKFMFDGNPIQDYKLKLKQMHSKCQEKRKDGKDRFRKKLSNYRHMSSKEMADLYNKQVTMKPFEDF